MQIASDIIARTAAGAPVYRIRLTNRAGMTIALSDWGARWLSANVPDFRGRKADVVEGYANPADYLTDPYYLGATVGRFANRIAGASFSIGEQIYLLAANDGRHTNHGGFSGFHAQLWNWKVLPDGVCFQLVSPDGAGGYPGKLSVTTEYRLSETNEVSVRHVANTDRSTYLNSTNHSYFNLNGTGRPVTGHILHIPACRILETTSEFIPTGKLIDVSGTPFDFTVPKPIGRDLYAHDERLHRNKGYNHCYVLKEKSTPYMQQAACLYDPASGRRLTVTTDLPGILLYTAGYYRYPHTAVCLETQFFPDTPSHPHFPSCLLRPNETYEHRTVFKFDVYKSYDL